MIALLSAVLFVLVFSVCGTKAFRLLASLAVTVVVLVYAVTPLIVHGYNPELVIILLGLPLLACIVYLAKDLTRSRTSRYWALQ